MNRGLYVKLAWTGIRKNKQLYYPYLLSGAVMVMVFYILAFLTASDMVHSLRGGEAMTTLLLCGEILIGLFSLPFLFYTSSSLMRKRKKEFGLYNILGMNKGNLILVLLWETLMTYGIVIFSGILFGVVFSKIAELGLVNIMEEEVNYHIYIEWKGILTAIILYAGIYLLIFLNMVRQIHQNNPIELLHSESAGERPPKSRWALAAAGMVLLVAAYIWAVRIENPREALTQLLLIGGVVVIGTYFLFIAGSVFLCGWLKKKKHYYYQTAHFVTISSLSYRMKRNGASLASICILSTVILVALVASIGCYAGVDEIIGGHYPYDLGIIIETTGVQESSEGADYRSEVENIWREMKADVRGTVETYAVGLDVPFENDMLDLSIDLYQDAPEEGNVSAWNQYLEHFVCIRVLSLKDYNRLCNASEELSGQEVLIAGGKKANGAKSIRSWDGSEYTVKKAVKEEPKLSAFQLYGNYSDMLMESLTVVVPDMAEFWKDFDASAWSRKNEVLMFWEYDVNLAEDREGQLAIGDACSRWVQRLSETRGDQYINYYTKAEKWARLKSLAGGVMFLAFAISGVFVFVATLIMYYKQISEGYEDQKQFSIMRKIGMTKREIQRSINSQMLTVFGLPLFVAGIHLTFAFPGIYQMLKVSILDDKPLLIKVALISFLLFALAYGLVYFITTRTYFRIVNRPVNE